MTGRRIIELGVLVVLAIAIILSIHFFHRNIYTPVVNNTEIEYQPKKMYGIVIDSMVVHHGKVMKNQCLSDILLKYDVPYPKIDHIASSFKSIFDVRKIRSGNKYSIFCTEDTLHQIKYFVYEKSPTSFIVFDLNDTVNVYAGEKLVSRNIRSTSGIINSSLWNSMIENGTNPYLAVELSDIYAWTIDFFGIQKGDGYRIIYEELIVEDDTIGIGNVIAASINHMGNEFLGFYFVQDSVGDYYDEDANSLRRTFLKAPLRYSRISSRYSNSRYHPVLKIRRPHRGVDYAAAAGTPVYTIGEGVVIEKGYQKRGGGNYLKVKHNSVYTSVYMHLRGYAKGIKYGVKVKQGDLLGYVGSTGLATGPHLDFRIYKNGSPVDPLKVQSPPAKPVDSANKQEYLFRIKELTEQLNQI